jgi:hypothetical protein
MNSIQSGINNNNNKRVVYSVVKYTVGTTDYTPTIKHLLKLY